MNFVEENIKVTYNLSNHDIERINDCAELCFNHADHHGLLLEVKETALEYLKYLAAPHYEEVITAISDAMDEWGV